MQDVTPMMKWEAVMLKKLSREQWENVKAELGGGKKAINACKGTCRK